MTNPQKEYRVFDIEYDTDGEPVFPNPPTEMNVVVDADREPEEAISDVISDCTGWCVFGFNYEEI